MARKQVIVNEEMIRGIMAGDIPDYGKDIPDDAIFIPDESEQDESEQDDCEANNPEAAPVEKSTGKQKDERKSRIHTVKNFLWVEMSCRGNRLISV